jgi:hypothetical protein
VEIIKSTLNLQYRTPNIERKPEFTIPNCEHCSDLSTLNQGLMISGKTFAVRFASKFGKMPVHAINYGCAISPIDGAVCSETLVCPCDRGSRRADGALVSSLPTAQRRMVG